MLSEIINVNTVRTPVFRILRSASADSDPDPNYFEGVNLIANFYYCFQLECQPCPRLHLRPSGRAFEGMKGPVV